MYKSAVHWLGYSLVVVAAAAMLTACVEQAPVGPDGRAAAVASELAPVAAARVGVPDLVGACEKLRVPAGSKLAFRVYAKGVQIHRWTGTSWSFVGPSAVLTADAGGHGIVGIHYSGPTWESVSGGKLVGSVRERCTPDPNAIAWLLLDAVAEGPGIFHRVAFIQRVNTVGGNAPSTAGTVPGEQAEVPYTTEYLFYRAP